MGSFSTFNVYVKNLGNGTATIAPLGGSTIGGSSTLPLTNGQSAWIVSDGTNYQTWATGGGGGGSGTPGGSTTQVQFNNSGSFGGSTNLTWVSPTLTIGASGATGQLQLTGAAAVSLPSRRSLRREHIISICLPSPEQAGSRCSPAAADRRR